MNNKYMVYALFVTVLSTGINWSNMFGSKSSSGGSGWSSRGSSYGGGFGGGGGGGGHK
jgi:hypothetical protein